MGKFKKEPFIYYFIDNTASTVHLLRINNINKTYTRWYPWGSSSGDLVGYLDSALGNPERFVLLGKFKSENNVIEVLYG